VVPDSSIGNGHGRRRRRRRSLMIDSYIVVADMM
jgi:hypothetical protein